MSEVASMDELTEELDVANIIRMELHTWLQVVAKLRQLSCKSVNVLDRERQHG